MTNIVRMQDVKPLRHKLLARRAEEENRRTEHALAMMRGCAEAKGPRLVPDSSEDRPEAR